MTAFDDLLDFDDLELLSSWLFSLFFFPAFLQQDFCLGNVLRDAPVLCIGNTTRLSSAICHKALLLGTRLF